MTDKKQILDKLNAFRERHKFADSVWNERGLNPSNIEMCNRLEGLFNDCADKLIIAANSKSSTQYFKKLLKEGLSNFNSFEYDTEEREFICDYFFELSNIVEVDLKDTLNSWLYGRTLNLLLKLTSLFKKPVKSNP